MLQRRPVITGTGIIAAAGCGVAAVWESIRANQPGLRPLTLFSSPRFARHLVGQVREDVDRLAGNVRGSRSDKLAWIAAREALAGAGLADGLGGLDPGRVGVLLGATVGGMLGTEKFLAALLRENKSRFGPLRFHECAGAADLCAQKIGARGPVATLSTACSAGALALYAAAELIEQGQADVMLAGAGDSLSRLTLNGFGSLLLLDLNGCRPFDARRAGISLGEGAAMLVLEAEETALARGAVILARLAGWGASCDAFHATAPQPEGRGAGAAMQRALARAGWQPGEIDFVSTHGTATPDNDAMESAALKTVFGGKVPPFSSVKRFFGHTLGASGAIKAVLAVQSLRAQAVPGTPGFEVADEKLGLAPVTAFRAQAVSRILSNSFGFGGNNVALGFEKFLPGGSRREETPISNQKSEIRNQKFSQSLLTSAATRGWPILSLGVVSPAGHSLAEIAATLRSGGAPASWFAVPARSAAARAKVLACGEFGADQCLDPARRRKLSRLQQMALVAARKALGAELAASVTPENICVALGTGLGSLADTAAFVENLILKDERAPRPALFSGSVHNSLASQAAIELHCAGLNSTPVQREIAFETALWQGATELAAGRAELALIGAADELNQYLLAAGLRWGWWQESSPDLRPFTNPLAGRLRPLPGEGCAMFALGRAESAASPLAFVSALRQGRRQGPPQRPIAAPWDLEPSARSAGLRPGTAQKAPANEPGQETGAPVQGEADAEAKWILQTLARDGIPAGEVDLLLTGANGLRAADDFYQAVAAAFSRAAGRTVPCAAYKQGCGEHHSASAFGFLTAIGLVRGEIASDRPVRTVVLYTLSPTGTKGMCCVRA